MGPSRVSIDSSDRFPGPETVSQCAEEYRRLLDLLGDQTLREIAELRVQGHTIDEIVERLGLAKTTVHRKLRLIRKSWLAEVPS